MSNVSSTPWHIGEGGFPREGNIYDADGIIKEAANG